MGYKLTVLNMTNRRHHDYYMSGSTTYYALVGRAFLEKWVERVKTFDNMTIYQEKTTYDSPADAYYYATFNNGELGASCGTALKFGTKKSSDTFYAYTGLSIPLADFYSTTGGAYTPHGVKCRFIVDDNNNLVVASAMSSRDDTTTQMREGFMFTNGGILGLNDVNIYSMGANPAIMGSVYSDMVPLVPGGDMMAYRADMLYLNANGELEIMDHVQFVSSPQLTRNNSGFFERIMIDDTIFVHVGCTMVQATQYGTFYKNDMWIPVDSVEEEEVEVVIHGDT